MHEGIDSWYTLFMDDKNDNRKMNHKLAVILGISVVCFILIIVYAANWQVIAAVDWRTGIEERLDVISGWVQIREDQKAELRNRKLEPETVYMAEISMMSHNVPAIMKVADHNTETIAVPLISQSDVGYRTGCELVSAAMVLQYYGMDVTPQDVYAVIDKRSNYMVNDKYGVHPNEFFIGDPVSVQAFGCYASPLVRAMNRILDESWLTVNVSGSDLDFLVDTYLTDDTPVIIWATINMAEPQEGAGWMLEDGTAFSWIAGEHCLVLVGEDADFYYFNDPNHAGEVVGYDKASVNERYEALGRQAVIVSR